MYHKFRITTDGNTYEVNRKKVKEILDNHIRDYYNRSYTLMRLDDGELAKIVSLNTSYLIIGVEES